MSNPISNGNSWRPSNVDDGEHKHTGQGEKPAAGRGTGFSDHSNYVARNRDHGANGAPSLGRGGMPHFDPSQASYDIRGLIELFFKAWHEGAGTNGNAGGDASGQGARFGNNVSGGVAPTPISSPGNPPGVTGVPSTNTGSSDGIVVKAKAPAINNTAGANAAGNDVSGSATRDNASLMGVQLDYARNDTIADYTQRTGVKPASVGGYVPANNGTLDMNSSQAYIKEAAQNGVPVVQLSINCGEKGDMSQQELDQFKLLAQQAKSQGVTLQVRFGYEMNLQHVSGYSDPETFKKQWTQVADAVHAGGGQTVWCPSNSTQSDYEKFLPDPSTIDVVGLDVYHMNSGPIQPDEVKNAISGIASVPGLAGKPITLPETGVQLTGDGSDANKVSDWLSQLSDPALKAQFPNYKGFMWFDYNKPGDGNYALSQNSQYEQALTQWYKG
jgi:beta-mannanase